MLGATDRFLCIAIYLTLGPLGLLGLIADDLAGTFLQFADNAFCGANCLIFVHGVP